MVVKKLVVAAWLQTKWILLLKLHAEVGGIRTPVILSTQGHASAEAAGAPTCNVRPTTVVAALLAGQGSQGDLGIGARHNLHCTLRPIWMES